jgi:hypothetical protein
MAVFTRVNGDAYGVNNVGTPTKTNANASIAITGVANPVGFIVVEVGGNLAAQLGSGGAVESIINSVSANATVMGYEINATNGAGGLGSQVGILVERSAWTTNVALESVIAAAGTVNGLSLSGVKAYNSGFNIRRDPAKAYGAATHSLTT